MLAIINSILFLISFNLIDAAASVTRRSKRTTVTTVTNEGSDLHDEVRPVEELVHEDAELSEEEKRIMLRRKAVKRLADGSKKYAPKIARLLRDVGSELYNQHKTKKTSKEE